MSAQTNAKFIHLNARSAFSLLEGLPHPKEYAAKCKELGMPAIGITDKNNLFAAVAISNAVTAEGIQPILGCSIGIRREDKRQDGSSYEPDSITLLVQSEEGWKNLIKLVSKAWLSPEPHENPQINLADLCANTTGLIALTGSAREGRLGRLLLEEQVDTARKYLTTLHEAFDDRLYVEMQRHDLHEEKATEADLVDLAYELNLPLVATNDSRVLESSQNKSLDVMLCIKHGKTLVDPNREKLSEHHYFKTAEEMIELFADFPEAIENTVKIAKRCAFKVPIGINYMPEWEEAKKEGKSVEDLLRKQANDGLDMRLEKFVYTDGMSDEEKQKIKAEYDERLDYELGIIEGMGFPGYFLIVSDFCSWAKENDIPVGPGRGSGAGSLVAWVLQITDVNPIPYGLLFERFLNPDRVSLPDFDIDFCQDRREEVIDYVRQKYGDERVAQIITFGTLKARACIRDVGRVLQLPFGQVSRIAAFIPEGPKAIPIAQAMKEDERLQELYDNDNDVKQLLDIAQVIEAKSSSSGALRHCSTHAAGVIIAPKPLDEICPLYRDPRAPLPATQFSMGDAEAAGLVKFDFLGLKTLTVIKMALDYIKRRGIDLDISTIPLDDKKSLDLLASGNTIGVFQVEGTGMQQLMRDAKPDTFADLVALISLYRPGPMENIPSFIARKHGKEEIKSIHESFDHYLEETYGIIVYQEQVMQCAQEFAGYTLGGADLLRRAMGKKKVEEMLKQRKIFVEGAVKRHGVSEDFANNIFDTIDKFAGYGFNKSHALAYALVGYQTLYLKAHYPLEFLAASMTLDRNNTEKVFRFKQELDRMGAKLLPPDINKSAVMFEVQDGGVRFALAGVKGAGEEVIKAMVAERDANGPYKDIFDFMARQNPQSLNRRQLEVLIKSGAFDEFDSNRNYLLSNVNVLLGYMQRQHEEKNSSQFGLFGGGDTSSLAKPSLKDVPPFDTLEQLSNEQAAIGFYLSAHPLDAYQDEIKARGPFEEVSTIAEKAQNGVKSARIVGIILAKREMRTKSGKRMAFLTISDHTGQQEVALFPEAYESNISLLDDLSAPLVAEIKMEMNGDMLRLNAESMSRLEEVGNHRQALQITLKEPEALDFIKDTLAEQQEGPAACDLIIPIKGIGRAVIRLEKRIQLKRQLHLKLSSIPSVDYEVIEVEPYQMLEQSA